MKKIAIFGNAGGGKSTLARHLAALTRLPLHAIDKMQFRTGSVPVPHAAYLKAHAELLRQDTWIIDGFGGVDSAWQRFSRADTLIHVDLPLAIHHWWVTRRLFQGLVTTPEGWPEGSPIWASTLSSYRVLWRCHRHLTPKYPRLVQEAAASKRVHHLKSAREIRAFLEAVAEETAAKPAS